MTNASIILDALGDGTRRAILERLAALPQGVTELAAALPVSRPAVSQHLRVLRDAELVEFQAEGTRRVYRVKARGVDELRKYLDQFWSGALSAFKRYAETHGKKKA